MKAPLSGVDRKDYFLDANQPLYLDPLVGMEVTCGLSAVDFARQYWPDCAHAECLTCQDHCTNSELWLWPHCGGARGLSVKISSYPSLSR